MGKPLIQGGLVQQPKWKLFKVEIVSKVCRNNPDLRFELTLFLRESDKLTKGEHRKRFARVVT
jgi:hypothetical protein